MDKKKISIAVAAVLVCLLICIVAIGQFMPKDRDTEEGPDTALPAEALDLINNYMSAFKKGADKSIEYIYMEDEFKRSAYINSGDMLIDYKIESVEKINRRLLLPAGREKSLSCLLLAVAIFLFFRHA